MTIKELEALVGLTRSNIRFYEQEGLLSPARQANGYRDYSQDDAETLAKIKLFRQLQLDLDSIHALQAGDLSLDQALERQLQVLETDQAALDRARQVCQALRESGTSYAALDPAPWLDQLAQPPVPASPRYAPPQDRYAPPETTRHPWRRYFARTVDLLICGLLWEAVCRLGFRWNPPDGFWGSLLNSYVSWFLLFLWEPLCLHFWGTTPGKALFGLSVRAADGEKLSWDAAMGRTWDVFGKGNGYGIPVYSLWRQWKSYRLCQAGEREPWEDSGPDGWEQYTIADARAWRCWACAGAHILAVGLAVLIALQAMLPPNRGPLTAEEFYENYNFYVDHLRVVTDHLDENGQSADVDRLTGATLSGMVKYQISVSLTEGVVSGVTVNAFAETMKKTLIWSDAETQLALLALAGSLRSQNCFNFRPRAWVKALTQQTQWDFDLNLWDLVHITRSTQLEGFENVVYSHILNPRPGETAVFRQEVQIRLTD